MSLLNLVRSRILYSHQFVQEPVLPPYVEGVFDSDQETTSFKVNNSYVSPPHDGFNNEDITTDTPISNNIFITTEEPTTDHLTETIHRDFEITTEGQQQTTDNIEKIIFTSAPFEDVTFRDDTIFFESVPRKERGDKILEDESFLPVPILEKYNVLVIPDQEYKESEEPELQPRFIDDGYLSEVDNSLEHPISYSYNYAVDDGPTGPQFSKHEASDGVLTKGEYSVILPDGRLQTVSYSVTEQGGFAVNVKYKYQNAGIQGNIGGNLF